MKNRSVTTNKQKLDQLFKDVDALRQLNDQRIEAQWATYLCIRVSGFLETSLQSIYLEYCQDKAHPNLVRYIGGSFNGSRSHNMKQEKILALAGAFSKEWRSELEKYIMDDGRKAAIDSIINLRNKAAHGDVQTITYHRIREYYDKIWDVIQFIDTQCQKR